MIGNHVSDIGGRNMKNLKRTLIVICFPAIFFCMMPMAFAGSSTQAGTTVTITAGNVPAAAGVDFIYKCCSPNISVEVFTTNSAFAIVTTNKLTQPGVGNNYAGLSTASGYAQQKKTLPAGEPVPDQTSLTLSGDWTWIGGSGS